MSQRFQLVKGGLWKWRSLHSPLVFNSTAVSWDLTKGCYARTAVSGLLIFIVFVLLDSSEVSRMIFSWVLMNEHWGSPPQKVHSPSKHCTSMELTGKHHAQSISEASKCFSFKQLFHFSSNPSAIERILTGQLHMYIKPWIRKKQMTSCRLAGSELIKSGSKSDLLLAEESSQVPCSGNPLFQYNSLNKTLAIMKSRRLFYPIFRYFWSTYCWLDCALIPD